MVIGHNVVSINQNHRLVTCTCKNSRVQLHYGTSFRANSGRGATLHNSDFLYSWFIFICSPTICSTLSLFMPQVWRTDHRRLLRGLLNWWNKNNALGLNVILDESSFRLKTIVQSQVIKGRGHGYADAGAWGRKKGETIFHSDLRYFNVAYPQ